MKLVASIVTSIVAVGAFASVASPQVEEPCARMAAVDTAGGAPDVSIEASVRAREVHFDAAPRLEVRLLGCPATGAVKVVERRNLPRPVQPGVTYRDVSIGVEIHQYLDVRCLDRAAGSSSTPSLDPRGRQAHAGLCAALLADSAARAPVVQPAP